MLRVFLVAAVVLAAQAAPFEVGTGLLPTGNLRSQDSGGPYNLTLLDIQQVETRAAIEARGNFTDADRIAFLTNVECLEGRFDSMGTLGVDFNNNLTLGGENSTGFGFANLSEPVRQALTEVAVSEQGHALFTRHAGSTVPCPYVDYTAGFNAILAAAYDLDAGQNISVLFGDAWDPYRSDETFLISMLFLEELGATGNKGLIPQYTNPVLADGQAGLATSATAFAAIERYLLFQRLNNTVFPTNETVGQVFARLSAVRDRFDGDQLDDQGITNADPRFIALGNAGYINNFPTDIRGLSFSRTPQQAINIYTLGDVSGQGGFFPRGLEGNIRTPSGYNVLADGTGAFDDAAESTQQTVAQVGTLATPITGATPSTVPDQSTLTSTQTGTLATDSYLTRGYFNSPPAAVRVGDSPRVQVGTPSGDLASAEVQPSPAAAGK